MKSVKIWHVLFWWGLAVFFALPAAAHDLGECDGFFHGRTYCAHIEGVHTDSGNTYIATVLLETNSDMENVRNQYRINCDNGAVTNITRRRRNQTAQARDFDNELASIVCN
jgi:hypothetical protein